MPSNWKQDTIIKVLGEAKDALTAHDMASYIDMNESQLSNYIRHNLLHKFIKVTRVSIQGINCAPWVNFYELTEQGEAKYRRLQNG